MTTIDNVIDEVKFARIGKNSPWIFENGKIKDDVFIGDVIPLLECLKEFEVENISEDYFEDYDFADNTYNWNANISNDLDFKIKNNYALVKVHLYGDIRGGYSDCFVVDMQEETSFSSFCFYFLEDCMIQPKKINERFVADIDIFSDEYSVYDFEKEDEVGYFYDLELSDLKTSLSEHDIFIE